MKFGAHVKEIIGNKAFLYEGMQCVEDPTVTVWRFLIYSGLVVEDDNSGVFQSELVAFTGSQGLIKTVAASF